MERALGIPMGSNIRPGSVPDLGIVPIISAGITIWGMYSIDVFDRDGRQVNSFLAKNDVTTPGLNHILDTEFGGGSQVATWYIGLITAGSPTLANGDTLASHAGWTEFTDYTGNRKEWVDDAASGGVKTNSTTADFVIDAPGTVGGLFLASVSSGTSGILWSTALLAGGDEAVIATNTLKVTYTINAVRS